MPIHREIIANSPSFIACTEMARRVADSSANVLIVGESGSGKEVIAQMIHSQSIRRQKPFVPLNCSAIPENLLESELFGYAKGAFTGATASRGGLFEEAEGGTLFLDEIADLHLTLQAKLLRVIQERKIKRVGENQYRPVNFRMICATHEDLRDSIRQKTFREDLYFRLNVITIQVPPLRDRPEDIAPLAGYFLNRFASRNGKHVQGFTSAALELLHSHSWPGNVRELENLVERAVVFARNREVGVEDLHLHGGTGARTDHSGFQQFLMEQIPAGRILPIERVTQLYIQYALELNRGAKDKTARDLGIDRKTLYRRLRSTQDRS